MKWVSEMILHFCIFCFGGLVLNEMNFEQLGLGSRDNHEWTGMVPNDRSSEIEINYKKVPFLLQFRSLRSRNKDKNRNCKIKITKCLYMVIT